MDLKSFIKGLSDNVFTDTPLDLLKGETEYMELDEWTSMAAFTLISYVDSSYGKKLTLPQLLMAQTIEELFNTVNS